MKSVTPNSPPGPQVLVGVYIGLLVAMQTSICVLVAGLSVFWLLVFRISDFMWGTCSYVPTASPQTVSDVKELEILARRPPALQRGLKVGFTGY